MYGTPYFTINKHGVFTHISNSGVLNIVQHNDLSSTQTTLTNHFS